MILKLMQCAKMILWISFAVVHSMKQFEKATLEELKRLLAMFERNRTIWIWHDHSSLASHGILAVMIGVVYDPIMFMTESEVGHSVQELVEEGEIHIVALACPHLVTKHCLSLNGWQN